MGGCCASKVLPDDPAAAGGAGGAGGHNQHDGERGATRGGPARVLSLGKFSADGFEPVVSPKGGDGKAAGGLPSMEAVPEEDFIKPVTSESAVKVAIAVRPMLDHEKGCTDVVQVMPPSRIQLPKKLGGDSDAVHPFEFDSVIRVDSPSASKQIFSLVLPVVERFTQGFNATVLAYGQTGSGKTYTMGTASSHSDMTGAEPRGVVPRTLMVLFSYIAAACEAYDISLKVSYIEVYNEQVVDLLSDQPFADAQATKATPGKPALVGAPKLDIRERANGEIFVDGAAEVVVSSREDVAQVLDKGNANRSVAAHKMNAESSRSHAIVTLVMEQRAKPEVKTIPADLRFLRSKLHLVDLAGSERQKDTGATGERLSEGININKGLLELGNVINALTEGKKRSHIPYRNSKLTRLLADSLGGNSETLFVACVSPADRNHEQTLNTLRYASRARKIRNNLRKNEMTPEEELQYLRTLVQQLQKENGELKAQLGGAPAGGNASTGAWGGSGPQVAGQKGGKAGQTPVETMVVTDF